MATKEQIEAWRAANVGGEGVDLSEPGETFDAFIARMVREGWTLVSARETRDDIAVIRLGSLTYGVGDVNGPWCCHV